MPSRFSPVPTRTRGNAYDVDRLEVVAKPPMRHNRVISRKK